MFCSKCGNEINSNVCCFCGYNNSTDKGKLNFKINSKGVLSLVIISVIIISAFIGIKSVASKLSINSSPEKVACAMVEGEIEIDMKKLMKCYPDFVLRELKAMYDLDENASLNDIGNKHHQRNFRFYTSYDVSISSTKIIEEITNANDIYYEVMACDGITSEDIQSIEKMVRVKVNYDADSSSDYCTTWTIKIDDKWYILPNWL